MIRDAERLRSESSKDKRYKHPVKININRARGIIKEDLIRRALERTRRDKETYSGHCDKNS
jgi:hypothetical protein